MPRRSLVFFPRPALRQWLLVLLGGVAPGLLVARLEKRRGLDGRWVVFCWLALTVAAMLVSVRTLRLTTGRCAKTRRSGPRPGAV